jgi:hypothetical protein
VDVTIERLVFDVEAVAAEIRKAGRPVECAENLLVAA